MLLFPFFFEAFFDYPVNVFLVILFLLTLVMVQVHLQPFKGKWQNVLDVTYLYYLIVLFTGVLFFSTKSDDDTYTTAHTAFSSIVIGIALLTSVPVFVYHMHIRFPKVYLWLQHCWARCRSCGKRKDSDQKKEELEIKPLSYAVQTTELSVLGINVEGSEPLPNNQSGLPRVVSFTEFREPLLDEGEVEVVSHAVRIWPRGTVSDTTIHGSISDLKSE